MEPKKPQLGASPYETELTTFSAFHPSSIFADSPTPSTPDLHEIESDNLFTFDHLKLLYHVQEHMKDWMMVTDRLLPLANFYTETALKTPYLMNQLLALSAMHLRTVDESMASSYTQAATHLRHRALRGFNRCLDDTSEENSTAQFFFASLLALHYLAETVTGHVDLDFAVTLDCTLNYFRLSRGARVMGDRANSTFGNSSVSQWLISASKEGPPDSNDTPEELATLAAMLLTSDLNEDSQKACEEAIEGLNFVMRHINSWGVHALMAWSNLIPLRFLTLLEKQIPEALVILAHYAILLHRFRAFWCLDDIGQRLVEGITRLLASYWATWLPKIEDSNIS